MRRPSSPARSPAPEGVSDLKFRWTFGDGSATVTGDVATGVTTAAAMHTYPNYRPNPYTATLTVTGKTDAGDIEASDRISVIVTEKESLVIGGWSAGETGRTAIRALSAVGAVLAQAAIWIGIFSPVWIVILVVGFFVRRLDEEITAVTTNIVTVAEQVNRGDDLPQG